MYAYNHNAKKKKGKGCLKNILIFFSFPTFKVKGTYSFNQKKNMSHFLCKKKETFKIFTCAIFI